MPNTSPITFAFRTVTPMIGIYNRVQLLVDCPDRSFSPGDLVFSNEDWPEMRDKLIAMGFEERPSADLYR